MEEKDKQDEPQSELKTGSGSLLASARKQQSRTVEEIAEELNLSVTQIKTIELDQSEGLPEPTYVRGYIRSYAKLLGLDPERVLDNYLNPNWQKSSSLEDLPKGIGSADQTDGNGFFTASRVIALLVLVTSLAFLWYSGILGDLLGSKPEQSSTNTPIVIQPEDSEPSVADTVDANTASESDTPTANPVSNELILEFTQTSWVDIRDGNDNRLAYKSYAAGEQLRVSSADSMSVFIGNAEGVSAQFNGAPYDISEFREGVYAKFNLGE